MIGIPEARVEPAVAALLEAAAERFALAHLERIALAGEPMGFERELDWLAFRTAVRRKWAQHDHVVVRGAPVAKNGASALLLSRAFGSLFKPYRGGQIVKHFRMSPWTTALSQTIADGDFHTDLNTSPTPPRVTVIQCLVPDPDTEAGGQVRVARLEDLLTALRAHQEHETLEFLTQAKVRMVDERSPGAWEGMIVEQSKIRYHPATLRAASKRYPEQEDIEPLIKVIQRYALQVSSPIRLERGDAVIVSNTRALHYRGPCTVRFRNFPRDFESREIFVLHLNDEFGAST